MSTTPTNTHKALLIVDAQPTFMPGGELPVPAGDAIIAPLCELIDSERYALVVFSRDWHPADHFSFSAQPRFQDGSWPPHGIAGTESAEVHPALLAAAAQADVPQITISKGMERAVEAYSAFDGVNLDTGKTLQQELTRRGIDRLDVGGLAGEVCVKFTVLAGLKRGYEIALLEAGTGFLGDPQPAVAQMLAAGVRLVGKEAPDA